MKKINQ